MMDVDKTGRVTKAQWIKFLQEQPQLGRLMTGETVIDVSKEACRETVAKQMRTMLKSWRQIDTDRSGTLEWEEFLEFFRSSGFLIEYTTKDNPKTRMADILQHLHDSKEQDVTELDEFAQLKQHHLTGDRRRSCGTMEANKLLTQMKDEVDEADDSQPVMQHRRQSLERVASGISALLEPTSQRRR